MNCKAPIDQNIIIFKTINIVILVFPITGDLFVLVFSMDSRESFEEVIRLREQILETKLSASGGRSKKNLPKVPMVIAGNKCDREMK